MTDTEDLMNGQKWSCVTMVLFGCVVVLSGIWRIVSADGGSTGLWFGLILGGFAWFGGLLFWKGRKVPAYTISFLCIALVGGWFGYESFVKKGFANSEVRQLLVICSSLVTAVLLGWLGCLSNASSEGSGDAR